MFGIFIKAKRCGHCNSRRVESGYFTRGWNNHLKQATGDNGYWCFKCCKISWSQPLEQYIAKLPKWCTAFENSKTLINNHLKPKTNGTQS